MQIINVEQRSPEWFKAREGRVTGSEVKNLLGARGLGKTGLTYAITKASESLKVVYDFDSFDSYAMQRGRELEPVALNEYEIREMQSVTSVGFVIKGDDLGVSPDGLVGEDGGIEIKCPLDTQHIKNMIENECPSEYFDQVQMCLYVTGRKWWDLVTYNPDFAEGLDYKRFRVLPCENWINKFETRLKEWIELRDKIALGLAKNITINN